MLLARAVDVNSQNRIQTKLWFPVKSWLIGVVRVGLTLRRALAFMLGINLPPPLPEQADRGFSASNPRPS